MAPLPPEEHLVTRADPSQSLSALGNFNEYTYGISILFTPAGGPSLLELVGLVAFIAILVSGLLGLLHYAL